MIGVCDGFLFYVFQCKSGGREVREVMGKYGLASWPVGQKELGGVC